MSLNISGTQKVVPHLVVLLKCVPRFLHTIAFLLINLLNLTVGEGSKPIFDREEIKRGIGETEEVEEYRTVVTVNLENLGMFIISKC